MTNKELVNKAIELYNKRDKWTYCHGCIGYLVDSPQVKNIYNYFLSIGKNKTGLSYEEWSKVNSGKLCTDCSNFINYLMGFTVSAWSTNSFKNMEETKPQAGAICWKDGHVGICISDTEFIHMPTYNRTFEKQLISNYDWKSFHKIPSQYVTYVEEEEDKPIYRVQVGAFYSEEFAKSMMNDLKSKGYPAYIVKGV